MNNIIKQYEYYFTWDEPIKYKELTLHPVLMSDYFNFYFAINCLLLEKDKIPDPKIISMSYLDYLFYLILNDDNKEMYSQMLILILKLCLKVEVEEFVYRKDEKGKIKFLIDDIEYDKDDFNNIRKIICYQNMPDYNDGYINPELEEAIKEAEDLQSRDVGYTNLERQLICVSKEYPYKIEELKNISIRKFVQMLQIADAQLHYKIYKTGECSGMVSFKTPISHYMFIKDKKFDSLINYDSFKEKMKQVT